MTIAYETANASVHIGDVRACLAELPDESIDCIVTSPPYFALRDYGVEGQIGLEPTPQAWCAALVEVFREARRVLKSTGTAWINVGDSYVASPKGPGGDDKSTLTPSGIRYQRAATPGPGRTGSNAKHGQERADLGATANRRSRLGTIKPKDLIGAPWMLALALRDDGWYLRQEIIWHKPDAFPESVRDRPTRAHEQVFLLSKSRRYFFDAEAIAEPVSESTHMRISQNVAAQVGSWRASGWGKTNGPMKAVIKAPKTARAGTGIRNNDSFSSAVSLPVITRSARSVWSIGTAGYAGAHFAVYPEELVARCIRAGTSAVGVCPECGAPWTRRTATSYWNSGNRSTNGRKQQGHRAAGVASMASGQRLEKRVTTLDFAPACSHDIAPVPATVLDPFLGSGTTAQVATRLGRRSVGIELNADYLPLIERRIAAGEIARTRASSDGPLVALAVSDLGPLWSSERERERSRRARRVFIVIVRRSRTSWVRARTSASTRAGRLAA